MALMGGTTIYKAIYFGYSLVSHDGARLCVWYRLGINGFLSIRTMLSSLYISLIRVQYTFLLFCEPWEDLLESWREVIEG